jgi:hypothetical protein
MRKAVLTVCEHLMMKSRLTTKMASLATGVELSNMPDLVGQLTAFDL